MNGESIFESQGFRLLAGYVICYAVGLVAAVVFAMSNDRFAANALYMIDHHATFVAIMSFAVLPIVGGLVVGAIILGIAFLAMS